MACNAPHTIPAQVIGTATFGTAPYTYVFEALTNDMTIDSVNGDTANVCFTPCTANQIKVTVTDAKGCVETEYENIPPACYVEMTSIIPYCSDSQSLLQVQFTTCGTSGQLFLIVAPASDPFNTLQASVLSNAGIVAIDISNFAGYDDLVVTLGDQQDFGNCQDQETGVEALDCCPGYLSIVQQNVSNTYAIDQTNHVFTPIVNDKDVLVTYDCVITKNGNPFLSTQKTDLGDYLRYQWEFDLDTGGYIKELTVTTDTGNQTISFDQSLTYDGNNEAAIKQHIEDTIAAALVGKTYHSHVFVGASGGVDLAFYGIHNPTGAWASMDINNAINSLVYSENGNTEQSAQKGEKTGNQSIGQAPFSVAPCEYVSPCGETIKAYYRAYYVDNDNSTMTTRAVENPNPTLIGPFGNLSATCVIKKLTAVVSSTPSTVVSYAWEVLSGDGHFDGGIDDTQSVEVYGTGSANYKVTVTMSDGCIYTQTKQVFF